MGFSISRIRLEDGAAVSPRKGQVDELGLQLKAARADPFCMEIIFFVATPGEACGVASSDDLPNDAAAEPIEADGLMALASMAEALGIDASGAATPLRDATCRSFPVWQVGGGVCRRLLSLDHQGLDECATKWAPNSAADPYERASCLSDLQTALREMTNEERLFALFEERAF